MKKLLLTTTLLLAAIIAFAYNGNTRLVITGATNNNIKIFIDGYNVGSKYRNGNSFIIDDASTANHRIQIVKQRTSIFGANEDKIIYDQNLYFKSNTQTNLNLNVFGTVDMNETPIYGNGNGGWDGSNNYPNNSPDWNGSNGNNGNQPQCGNDKERGYKNGHRKHHKRKKYYDDEEDDRRNGDD